MHNTQTKFKETEIGTIPEKWNIFELENIVKSIIDYRGKTPKKTSCGIPLVTAKVVKDGRINFTNSEYIAEDDYVSWMRRGIPKSGDVVITTEAPLGEVAQLPDFKIALAQRIITLSGKDNILDNTYLKYYFLSPVGSRQLKLKETGSVVTGVKQSELRKVKILVPSFLEQKQIADILSSLDDKIELNRKINANLEKLGNTIFKQQFVCSDTDSQVGWEKLKVSDFIRVESGFPFQSGIFDVSGKYHLVTIKNVQDGYFVVECTDSLNELPNKMPQHCILKNGDILLSLTGNVGRICIVNGQNYLLNQRVATLIPIDEKNRAFTYFLFRQKDFQKTLINISHGTAQQNLSPIETRSLEITIPTFDALDRFSDIGNSIFHMLIENFNEIRSLVELRDSLLSRLMNGKIKVKI